MFHLLRWSERPISCLTMSTYEYYDYSRGWCISNQGLMSCWLDSRHSCLFFATVHHFGRINVEIFMRLKEVGTLLWYGFRETRVVRSFMCVAWNVGHLGMCLWSRHRQELYRRDCYRTDSKSYAHRYRRTTIHASTRALVARRCVLRSWSELGSGHPQD